LADTQGSIKVLMPRANTLAGQFKGTADAVYQYLDIVQAHRPDLVAVFAADHIYRMDVRQMVAHHVRSDAEVTVSALAVPVGRAHDSGVLSAAAGGRVPRVQENPTQPAG